MGGQSTGTWKVENEIGVMNGVVADVPSLKAPGFIKAAADGSFPNASAAAGGSLELLVRSKTPEYKGFRVTVAAGALSPAFACGGGGNLPLSRGCYKAKFSVPGGDGWQRVVLPLSSFSDLWSSATGEHTKECSEDASACLTAKKLALPRCGQDAGVVHSIRGPRTRGAHTARPRALHDPSWHTA